MKQIKISVVAALAIDQLNKTIMEKWLTYVDQQFDRKKGSSNETR